MRALVAGWFSFEQMAATAGDLLARDVACEWLVRAGLPYDVAHGPAFAGGVDWRSVDPTTYSHVVFVCGPFGNGEPITDFLHRFRGSQLVGVGLSLLEPLATWNPFDLLLERDSSRATSPDLSFLAAVPAVPVIGVVLVHDQHEYRRPMHGVANDAIDRLTRCREMATVAIDTCLDPPNTTRLRTPAEIESLIARMDVVLTTRLHGMVLALKHGVPALVIDPIAGGAKVKRQADTIGWPVVFTADDLTDERLEEALRDCLGPVLRQRARECADRAARAIAGLADHFIAALVRRA